MLRTWGVAGVCAGMLAGASIGIAGAQALSSTPAAADVLTVTDLIKALGVLGAVVGVYVALDRRVTRAEVAIEAGVQRILDRLDGRGGLVDRLSKLEGGGSV